MNHRTVKQSLACYLVSNNYPIKSTELNVFFWEIMSCWLCTAQIHRQLSLHRGPGREMCVPPLWKLNGLYEHDQPAKCQLCVCAANTENQQ